MAGAQRHGILKHDAGAASGRRANFDEANLAENERIKAELNPTKIDEPKTPYHPPLEPDAGAVSTWSGSH